MELTQKGEMVSRLQAKASQIGKILNNLEKYNHLIAKDPPRTVYKKPAQNNQLKKTDTTEKFKDTSGSKDDKKTESINEKPKENVENATESSGVETKTSEKSEINDQTPQT